ncbi:hypothetical protein OBJ92_09015 [Empedobacter falsenii]
MTQLIDPNDIHSAADTWSGFIYQGKIALYHVLKIINEKDNVDGLHLQLDSLEDFAIVRYDDDNIIPISLHQVKAMKSNLYSAYKDAFDKLEKRKVDYPCDDNAYFHLANKNQKSKTELESFHPNLKIYQYNNKDFCEIKELQDLIIENLKLCLSKIGKDEFLQNDNYLMNNAGVLEDLITCQILAVHACNHMRNGLTISEGAYHFTIPLGTFLDKLHCDYNESLFDNKFYFKRVLLDLNNYFQEFSLDFEDEIDEIQREKLSNYLICINSLDEKYLKDFLQKISPHKEIKFSNLSEYRHNTIDNDDFKIAFLYTLKEIRDSDNIGDSKFGWTDLENKNYFPSTINKSNNSINNRMLCRNIIETSQNLLVDVPFNSDFIITDSSNINSIEDIARNIYNIELENEYYDKITNWRKISLIDREQAKQKLNDNNN